MKKTLALVLGMVLAFALAIPTFATDAPPAEVEFGARAERSGNQVVYTIAVETVNAGITAMKFVVGYDNNNLTYVSAVGTPEFGGMVTPNANGEDILIGAITATPVNAAVDLITVTFDLASGFEGDLVFTIDIEELYWSDSATDLMGVVTLNDPEVILTIGGEAPPTDAPPTDAPPTDAPPTDAPPTDAPPTDVPPTDVPPTDAPPTDAPPTDVPPTDGPTDEPPVTDEPTGDPQPTDEIDPPVTGGMTMAVVAAISAIAGLGALGLRRKND